MRETILKALYDIAKCNGNDCQVNLGSESARVMITNKLMEELKRELHIRQQSLST